MTWILFGIALLAFLFCLFVVAVWATQGKPNDPPPLWFLGGMILAALVLVGTLEFAPI